MSVTNTLSSGQSRGKPQLRTLSTIPSWRQNSMVRTLTSSILAGLSLFSRSSTSSVATPRRPRSAARASPIGPPPAIRTGVSTVASRPVMLWFPLSGGLGFPQPRRPVFPGPGDRARLQIERPRLLDFHRREVAQAAKHHRLALHLGVPAGKDRAENELFHRNARDRRSVPAHQHHPVRAERPRQRSALLRLRHDQIGVAEFIALVPERDRGTHRRAEVIDRLQRH